MNILKNEAVYQRGEEVFRVIKSGKDLTYFILINSNPKQAIQNKLTSQLITDLNEGLLYEIPDTYRDISTQENLTENQKDKAEKYFNALNRLWNSEDTREAFLIKSRRKEIIKILTKELELSESGVRKLITSFFRGGMTYNSVVPKYHKRSGFQKQGDKKGRKRRNNTLGIPITKKERDLFEKYYQKEHLRKHKTYKNTFSALIKNEYTREVRLPDGRTQRIALPENEKPTYPQFYYWIKKRENRAKDREDFVGKRDYNNNIRIDRGSSLSRTTGPGKRYEMDATHLNVTVVSQFDRSQPLGRPLLYSTIDTFSKMVTGFLVTLKNESWETSAATIINTARDKVEFCADYNIAIQPEDWPSKTLPQNLVIDNGRAKTVWIKNLFNVYGVELESTAPYYPRQKSNIEHKHSDYKRVVEQFLPGADSKREGERGVKDSRIEATLTLEELTRVLIEMTLYFNHQPITDYPLTLEMEEDGVNPTPVELWQWGYENGLGAHKEVTDLNQLRYVLLPRVERKVTRKGIRFNNNYYIASDELTNRFLNNHLDKRIEFAYDQNNINFIYASDGNTFYPLKIKNKLSEVSVISFYDLENRRVTKEETTFTRERMIGNIEKITKEANKKNRASRAQKRKNLKNLKEKRREEINRTSTLEQSITTQTAASSKEETTRKKSAYDIQREKFLAQKKAERKQE